MRESTSRLQGKDAKWAQRESCCAREEVDEEEAEERKGDQEKEKMDQKMEATWRSESGRKAVERQTSFL